MSFFRHGARDTFGMVLMIAWLTLAFLLCHKSESRAGADVHSKPVDAKFTANERAVIEQAMGPTDDLSEELQRAFALTDEFTILPPPEPGDWLYAHPENGQTFSEFVGSRPNMPTRQRKVILLPLGEFKRGVNPSFDTLTTYTQTYFTLDVKLLAGVALKDVNPTERINRYTLKRQLYAPHILQYLIENLPDDAYCLIAITMIDLYHDPNWNYVFGYASLRERVGVFSFARYDPAFFEEQRPADYRQLILRRSLNVMAHEIGHMFGLEHCTFLMCIMNGSNNLEEMDRSPLHLCPICLRKLAYVTDFDVVDRYRNLARFYGKIDFAEEAEWISGRLETVTDGGQDKGDSGGGGGCFIACSSNSPEEPCRGGFKRSSESGTQPCLWPFLR